MLLGPVNFLSARRGPAWSYARMSNVTPFPRRPADPSIADRVHVIEQKTRIIIAGLAFGLLPGIFAAVLATFVAYFHVVGDFHQFFPSSASMILNGVVIACINLFVAAVAASHWSNRKRLEITLDELNHRTKNLLTVISSIANRLARGTNDIDSFREAIDKRLRSMAAAHDLLVKNEWKDTTLSSVVSLATAPFFNRNQITVQQSSIDFGGFRHEQQRAGEFRRE
jgi:two-component sensor histidine kinase